eukprot:COSAG01_NODE_9598_length_2395_cov_1.765244_3_plen_36_part_01
MTNEVSAQALPPVRHGAPGCVVRALVVAPGSHLGVY